MEDELNPGLGMNSTQLVKCERNNAINNRVFFFYKMVRYLVSRGKRMLERALAGKMKGQILP